MNKTLILLTAAVLTGTATAQAQNTPTRQMEKLTRGVVAVPASTSNTGNFISWRFLGTDDEDRTTFDVIRNSTVVKRDLYETNYQDDSATRSATYRIVTKIDGTAVDTTEAVPVWSQVYKTLTLDRPATGTNGGTYAPNDCSVGDVDGDGQYEIFVKWDPSNSKDNSQSGITDNVIIDCYKLDGTKLWRIDLGRNIRAGAHYTQFMVYDFDGDGKAEMMCKTGPGSLDSKGNYVNSVATEDAIKAVSGTALYRSSDGRITGGQEWLTVFSGETGEAIHTIFYNPNRNMTYGGAANGSVNWGDVDGKNDAGSYGNRGERYLAAVAYLDGPDKNPSGIFSRGYYGYAFIWAVDFDGKELKQKWFSAHKSKTAYNQPPHLGYYLPDAMEPQFLNEQELTVAPDEPISWTLKWRHAKTATVSASYLPDGTRKALVVPTGLTRTINSTDKTFTLTGALSEEGDYRIEIRMTALDGSAVTKSLTIHVGTVDTGIRSVPSVTPEPQQAGEQVFDLQGRQRTEMKPGEIYIIRRGAKVYKVKP